MSTGLTFTASSSLELCPTPVSDVINKIIDSKGTMNLDAISDEPFFANSVLRVPIRAEKIKTSHSMRTLLRNAAADRGLKKKRHKSSTRNIDVTQRQSTVDFAASAPSSTHAVPQSSQFSAPRASVDMSTSFTPSPQPAARRGPAPPPPPPPPTDVPVNVAKPSSDRQALLAAIRNPSNMSLLRKTSYEDDD